MAYHFVQLTKSSGGQVFINGDIVAAVYPYKYDTIVQFAGGDENYILVTETVNQVIDRLIKAMDD